MDKGHRTKDTGQRTLDKELKEQRTLNKGYWTKDTGKNIVHWNDGVDNKSVSRDEIKKLMYPVALKFETIFQTNEESRELTYLQLENIISGF